MNEYFLLGLAILLAGYAVYGGIVEKIFGADARRPTPAVRLADGVDYVAMHPARAFLIQLLNIAGLGPVFGPVLGALYGPVALLWVALGSVFAGAVHDYLSGMLSLRHDGKSIPDVVGAYLGRPAKLIMRVFSVLLLVLVGVVFVAGPAGLLADMTGREAMFFVAAIFIYYFLATILPIHTIIGRIYPFFALLLLFMALSLIIMLYVKGYEFYPEGIRHWTNLSTHGLPVWPLVFITIACGACSGFHATQSPMMARCLRNEKHGRPVFYGAMIAEGIIGLIWTTLGMAFYEFVDANLNPAVAVNHIANELLGSYGAIFAVLGVVVLPVTSGDTAFRSARLTIADAFGFSQKPWLHRLAIAVPLFAVGVALNFVDFDLLWRYFGWANQSLAAIMLWTGAAYLLREKRFHWIATLPAMFMTAVSVAYICYEETMGLGLTQTVASSLGAVAAFGCAILLLKRLRSEA